MGKVPKLLTPWLGLIKRVMISAPLIGVAVLALILWHAPDRQRPSKKMAPALTRVLAGG